MPSTPNKKPLLLALYLPQYHPIPENDEWWGKGFTEWTNVAKARPMFKGHYQPHIPADLGFYDLRVPEVRQAQSDLAMEYGIDAFCYYQYWFAGRRLLERPFNEVLASGKPDLPFCLCWANHSWTGVWMGLPNKTLIEQPYPGDEDTINYFNANLPAFRDKRYLRIDGKPVFCIYNPPKLTYAKRFTEIWQELAIKNGLPGIHFIGFTYNWRWDFRAQGFDGALAQFIHQLRTPESKISPNLPNIYSYAARRMEIIPGPGFDDDLYPCLRPNWDNTARSGTNGMVMHGSTPELFRGQVQRVFEAQHNKPEKSRVVFIKSWNEWAEGNHLEPDLRYGHQYLEVIRSELKANGWF